jgi:glutamate formiminotransferase
LIFECVPNVSEGRNGAVIDACAEAIRTAGAQLADRTSDPDHNRSVFTFFGDAETIVRAAGALAAVCAQRIEMRDHSGVHPRLGALDVLPVVPMTGATLDDAARVARACARAIWDEAALPSIFYGAASTPPGRLLSHVRRGEFEGLAGRADAGERPDAGDRLFHPSAGTVAVGARPVLIAFNLVLGGAQPALARSIASALRERGGGLRSLRVLGLHSGDTIQVSCNITDVEAVPLGRLIALVERMAARHGARLESCETIGLLPREAVRAAVLRAFDGDGGSGPKPNLMTTEIS